MALAIDTIPAAETLIPRLQRFLDQYTSRYQIHRVCAIATVIHGASAFRRLLEAREGLAKQEALDWQADQGDDLDDGEVIHHLQQQAATSPLLSRTFSQTELTNSTTTLVASVLSPSLMDSTQGRPLSSFHRQSIRCSFLNKVLSHAFAYSSNMPEVFPNAGEQYAWVYFPQPDLRIVWAKNTGYKPFVVWNLQLDVVDLTTRVFTTYSGPWKRRRAALNPFLQVPSVTDTKAKRFRGVRYRPNRKKWVAEMKPPGYKNKVSFGDFESETQAARAVDAAFHQYDKTHWLNFPDSTPGILSSRPKVAGLDEKAKLRKVKEQAKWLASIDSNSVPFEAPEAWWRSCSGGFGSFTEIASSFSPGRGADDKADDGIFQPVYPMDQESIVSWSPGSSAQGSAWNSTDTYPELSTGMLASLEIFSQSCMEFLAMSPPASMRDICSD